MFKDLLRTMYEKIWCLFAFTYWMQLYGEYPYNKVYDKWCRDRLKEGCVFESNTGYTADFSGKTLWIANHPYASFHLYDSDSFGKSYLQFSPSRYTKYLLNKRLKESTQSPKEINILDAEKEFLDSED